MRFTLAGFPVQIHWSFFLVAALLGRSRDLYVLLVWIGVVFVSVLLHEMGHALEESDLLVLQRSMAHYYARTKGEKLRKMSSLTGGDYRADEVSREDLFVSPYYGKRYKAAPTSVHSVPYGKTKQIHSSTEIISMGIEDIYSEPVGLAERDPEMFRFILRELHRRDKWNAPLPKDIPGFAGVIPVDPRPLPSAFKVSTGGKGKALAKPIKVGSKVMTPVGPGTVTSKVSTHYFRVNLDAGYTELIGRNNLRVI